MALKTRDELLEELKTALRSNGENGKTKAEELRTFLKSLIVELTTPVTPPGGSSVDVESTDSIALTKDAVTKAIKADLIYSDTADITLLVNPPGGLRGLQGKLNPILRSSLPIYIGAANDGRFLFYSGGKTYAFASAGEAVAHAKVNNFTGAFVFRSNITEPLELLHNCTYDMTGFDSVVSQGSISNFRTSPQSASLECKTSLKIRQIIQTGTASAPALYATGPKTEVSVEGDILVSSTISQAMGIHVSSSAKLRYRGNVEVQKSSSFAVYQYGDGSVIDFVGNILTNTTLPCDAINCTAGILDFTGRIDVLGLGSILQYHPNRTGNHSVRLNLTGATSKDKGLNVNSSLNTQPQPSSRLYVKGLIDMRNSILNDPYFACGMLVQTVLQMDIQFENLTILTKPNIPPVKCGTASAPNNFPISIIGSFQATQGSIPGEFNLQKITPFRLP